ncbi:hypothetical protein DYI24_00765 [Rhodopseudomonas sp. BR0C11]|uniref:hypothetical protein n=1 Tax=Rhodopseudomonas sp. BR0C11 TaxID=2269370 RepID=UPI0013DEC5A8|nr:hypothetical protein [Rhodopseudomonas sp. BR0C11]NEV75609.1 hypothetical protein [Rhodopseudomonas sp. BR0C11]
MKATKHSRWVIVGLSGLYTGQWLTRAAAIAGHVCCSRRFDELDIQVSDMPDGTNGRLSTAQRELWAKRRADGDRCIKATIIVPAFGKGGAS